MQPRFRWLAAAERGCLAIFFAWLIWLPLPFGSMVEAARLPLIAVPLFLAVVALVIRLVATRDRTNTVQPTRPWLIWGYGMLLFCVVMALQLVPLPPSVLRLVSPASHEVWSSAARVVALGGQQVPAMRPVSVDPAATAFELCRLFAIFASFLVAALLIRMPARRMALIVTLGIATAFQIAYGVREAALGRYTIWGWENKLVLDRATGTFVNPNHFAHYVALFVPLALFVAVKAWRESGNDEVPFARRMVMLVERRIVPFGLSIVMAIACIAAILLAQSRGGLLSLTAGLAFAAALLPAKRPAKLALGGAGLLIVVAALILFLGTERTIARFAPSELERSTLVGRRIGIAAGMKVWHEFPIFGSGLGTFERVVLMEQPAPLERLYHHVHNDYVELAATSGTLGFVITMVALIGGFVALLRMARDRELTWRRRAFILAALASLTIALVHALFDFNFYIPSNPATLAAILGAAVASLDHDRRARRAAIEQDDSRTR